MSLNDDVRNPLRLAQMGAQWLFGQRGPLTVGAGQVGGLVAHRACARTAAPTCCSTSCRSRSTSRATRCIASRASRRRRRSAGPSRRGTVEIARADPLAPPRIRAGYLTEPHDAKVLVAGLQHAARDLRAAGVPRTW